MKIDQKNPRNLFMAFSCMLEQLMTAVQGNLNKWHLNNHKWSLNLNLWFKPTSFNCVASCISSNHSMLPCHDHASYCCIALIVFFLCLSVLSPLSRRRSDDEFDDTDEDPMLSSEVPGKQNPIEHSDTIPLSRSCSLLLHQDNNASIVTCCGS